MHGLKEPTRVLDESDKMPLPKTETLAATHAPSTTSRTTKVGDSRSRSRSLATLGHVFVGTWAAAAAIATATQLNVAQLLERQIQTLFFEVRGPVKAPQDIVILAMDADTISQGKSYLQAPEALPFFEPLQTAPPKRAAYAIAIDRLMQAGARSVALDVVLDVPSAHGPEDDQPLQKVLQKYPGRVTLAAIYEDVDSQTARQRDLTQLAVPTAIFQTNSPSIGFINFPLAPNGRIQSLGSKYLQQLVQDYSIASNSAEIGKTLLDVAPPSFAEAALRATRQPYPQPKGDNFFFYGPAGTFKHVPFWQALDPESWKVHLNQGTFKDKLVVIGPTATIYQDAHAAPFSGSLLYPNPMSGVEIQASAIATLLENKSIAEAIPNPSLQGLFVLIIVAAAGYLQSRPKRSLFRFALAAGLTCSVGMVGYVAFVHGHWILPVAIPMAAIALSGVTYFVTASAREYQEKLQLREILKDNPDSEIARKIISQHYDLQDLLKERERELFGTKLRGRYKIVKVLGSGGFGETYVAEDTDRPGNPTCVVKWLKPASKNFKLLKLAKRLFDREAQTLAVLGNHDQIPQLLAYFEEEEEFYLVQEYIAGQPLNSKLGWGKTLPESQIIAILQELLKILEFVHGQGVIHRDIKPSNIILRNSDGKPVLIDFGAVKEIHQLSEEGDPSEENQQTIGIGTKGYMPIEQGCGEPRPNSDIYAVGMIGIQALTGLPPSELPKDSHAREIIWKPKAQQVSHALADVLSKMVRFHYTDRYQTATEALNALKEVAIASTVAAPPLDMLMDDSLYPMSNPSSETSEASETSAAAPTKIWSCDSTPEITHTTPAPSTESTPLEH